MWKKIVNKFFIGKTAGPFFGTVDTCIDIIGI